MAVRKKPSENYVETITRDRPYALEVMQTQLLYDVASMMEEAVDRLTRIEELLVKPKGYICPIKLTIDRPTIIDFSKEYPYTPLFSLSLFNDGPDEVYVGINIEQKVTPLKAGESFEAELYAPNIKRLYLYVEAGKTANIRGFGIY